MPNVVVDPPANVATGSPSSTIWVAVMRSAWSAIAAGLLAGFTAYQTMEGNMDDDTAWKKAAIVGIVTLLGPFAARGGAEGIYDASRQKAGNATPADVTPTPTK